ncbi:MAG: hypothetical protein NW203_01840 [Hyphomonadaceae bacterium]|nr:hypothetical protein [Hyphomonadaceae bacterium]
MAFLCWWDSPAQFVRDMGIAIVGGLLGVWAWSVTPDFNWSQPNNVGDTAQMLGSLAAVVALVVVSPAVLKFNQLLNIQIENEDARRSLLRKNDDRLDERPQLELREQLHWPDSDNSDFKEGVSPEDFANLGDRKQAYLKYVSTLIARFGHILDSSWGAQRFDTIEEMERTLVKHRSALSELGPPPISAPAGERVSRIVERARSGPSV